MEKVVSCNCSPQDWAEINQLLAAYTYAADYCDKETAASLFASGAWVDTEETGVLSSDEFIEKHFDELKNQAYGNEVANIVVFGNADQCTVYSYWMMVGAIVKTAPEATLVRSGFQKDVCVYRDGQWKFLSRTIYPWNVEKAAQLYCANISAEGGQAYGD